MHVFLKRYNYFFLVLLVFGVAEIIVNPIADFPLNDDWSYGKAVYYSLTKSYTIGNFGAMSLLTHVMWGTLFVKIFGFSFTVFRFSTLVSVLISLFFLDRLVFSITKNKIMGCLACIVLLFNPLYFNLANTYMTDVNFNTLFVLACYYAFRFFDTKKIIYVAVFFILSVLLVLLRQFGIIVPVCFLAACFFLKEKKFVWILVAFSVSVGVYYSLHLYEAYLKTILPADSAYKFSGGVHITDKEFWKAFNYNLGERYKILLVQVFIYTAPVAAYFFFPLFKVFKVYTSVLVVTLSTFIVYWFFKDTKFPFSNIFENAWLGPETFYESLSAKTPHVSPKWLANGIIFVKYTFCSITFSTLSLYFFSRLSSVKYQAAFVLNPKLVFLTGFFFAYMFMIFITESYFDRYFIPLISCVSIALCFMNKHQQGNYKPTVILTLIFFYVSVFGTKDYLTWNRMRWEAYKYLQETKGVTAEHVNGGFELNCWNDLKETWWSDYLSIDHFNYLIQFKNEPGFKLLKEYEFQRYFPYQKDKINIFVRELAP